MNIYIHIYIYIYTYIYIYIYIHTYICYPKFNDTFLPTCRNREKTSLVLSGGHRITRNISLVIVSGYHSIASLVILVLPEI